MTSWRALKQWSAALQFVPKMTKSRKYKQGKVGDFGQRPWVIDPSYKRQSGHTQGEARRGPGLGGSVWKGSGDQRLGPRRSDSAGKAACLSSQLLLAAVMTASTHCRVAASSFLFC